jgi:hypothetical protein
MTVPKTAMAPKPATTSTITRGGFGESVAKQTTMQRSAQAPPLLAQWAADHGTSQYHRAPGLARKSDRIRFNFHTMYGEPYWCEDAYYKLTLAQVEKLEEVTAELHQMCLKVVEKVIDSDELMANSAFQTHLGLCAPVVENQSAVALLAPRSGVGRRG